MIFNQNLKLLQKYYSFLNKSLLLKVNKISFSIMSFEISLYFLVNIYEYQINMLKNYMI